MTAGGAARRASVVIATYNRRDSLRRALEALAEQQAVDGGFEVVVVSDGSDDGTYEFLTSSDVPLAVVAIQQENAGPAAARNRAIEVAKGDVIVFIDDDTVPERDFVASHLRHHAGADDDVVVLGPMSTPPDHTMTPWVAWEQAKLESHYAALASGELIPTARQFYTGNASVARRRIVAAGGFNTDFKRAEDVELAYRLADQGARFTFDPGAVVYHYARRSLASWMNVARSYGRYDVLISRQPDRGWLLEAIANEFHERHWLVRFVTRTSLARPVLARAVPKLLATLARGWARVGLDRFAKATLSGAYNLTYYGGMAEEFGGSKPLLAFFKAHR